MWGHFGFSYVGFIYLLMLWIPNIIWSRHLPADYNPSQENRILLAMERIGQVCCSCSIVLFRDYNLAPFTAWSLWIILSFLLMILYEACWIRYFTQPTLANFYRRFFGIPVPLASLPVAAFLLLGIYGRVIWLILSAIIIGIGHIGIHLGHEKAIKRHGLSSWDVYQER